MITLKYSSGLVAESCWFIEFKEYLKLRKKGLSDEDIKKEIIDTNLFGAPNNYRSQRIYGYIKRRADTLDEKGVNLFFDSDLSTQKLINLICILRTSRIFFEFVNEVYKEKVILGAETIEPSDVSIFFKNKFVQSEEVAEWKAPTIKRISNSFLNMLTESNLLVDRDKHKYIKTPIIDILLEKYLESNGESDIIKAMTGEY